MVGEECDGQRESCRRGLETGINQVMQGVKGMDLFQNSVDLFQTRGQQTWPDCLFLYKL